MTNGTETLRNGTDRITAQYFDLGTVMLANSKGERWLVDEDEWAQRREALLDLGWK
jgi:hypothetical protein